jgi:hypothetical protein
MRTIPAFSKKSSGGPTVGGSGQRSGFTDNVKSTNAGKGGLPSKGMAGFQGKGPSIGSSKQSNHPPFKAKSSTGLAKGTAFSKKKI